MQTQEETVKEFLAAWKTGDVREVWQNYLSDDVLWQNTGLPDCKGIAECMPILNLFLKSGTVNVAVDLHHIASHGNTVLVERTDNCLDASGTVVLRANCMAAVEVSDGKITRFSDYYDLKPFLEFGMSEPSDEMADA